MPLGQFVLLRYLLNGGAFMSFQILTKNLILAGFIGALGACSGANSAGTLPVVGKYIKSASTDSSEKGTSGTSGDQKTDEKAEVKPNDADASAGVIAGQGVGAGALPGSSHRWVVMGDFGLAGLEARNISDCTSVAQIAGSGCTTLNSHCKSTFESTCPDGTCRRLFKCITGQTNSLIWFPMGDNHTTSATSLPICSVNSNIAGSACTGANDRCLSSFCTSGSGQDCGRRLFKCLTSGIPGQFYYRWMGDKPVAELAGIAECAATQNIAGSQCFSENSRCISQFFTDAANTKRRLFKCTP
jgi:hypothetical protein